MATKTIDYTSLSGWDNVSYGQHQLTIIGKANGFKNSEPSLPVSVTKTLHIDPYLTFTSSDGFNLELSWYWDGTMEYSTDLSTWNVWEGEPIEAQSDGNNYNIYLRGTNNTNMGSSWGNENSFRIDAYNGQDVECNGNIEVLLDYATVVQGNHPPMANSCFFALFANNDCLVSCPALPATTLEGGCYTRMFKNCSRLETLPALPATYIPQSTYSEMFVGCSSIYLSTTQDGTYTNAYRIPKIGEGTVENIYSMYNMFGSTGGTFTGTPSANTTYYTSNSIVDTDGTIISGDTPPVILPEEPDTPPDDVPPML